MAKNIGEIGAQIQPCLAIFTVGAPVFFDIGSPCIALDKVPFDVRTRRKGVARKFLDIGHDKIGHAAYLFVISL